MSDTEQPIENNSPKPYKYNLKIPKDPEAEVPEYKEVKLQSKDDVMKFLDITTGQFTRLANNTLKCKSYTNSKLKGIIIERIGVDNSKKDKTKRKEKDNEYLKALLEKVETK